VKRPLKIEDRAVDEVAGALSRAQLAGMFGWTYAKGG
jgi:hypothetical protein